MVLPSTFWAVPEGPGAAGLVDAVIFNRLKIDHRWAIRQAKAILELVEDLAEILPSVDAGLYERLVSGQIYFL